MKILYIYPHPDDESFGPAQAISKQRRQGHEVHLLTLTRGGATRQRYKYGYSIAEMGEVRFGEMQEVAKVLDLTSMTVLDLPDSGLKDIDPREIEQVVAKEIDSIRPNVLVTYPVHGISGFHDHLVTHAAVKHVFCELQNTNHAPKRLAFHSITEEKAVQSKLFPLSGSKPEEIDCEFEVDDIDMDRAQSALDCYKTFRETIDKSGIRELIDKTVVFEFFAEHHTPPLADIFTGLM